MQLWKKAKKIVALSQKQEPVTAATPSADVLRDDIEFATSTSTPDILANHLIILAPLRVALRDALLQKKNKLDRLMYNELEQKCWFLIAQQVRHDYSEVRTEVRAAMARGLEYGRKVQNAKEEQILSRLVSKLDVDEFHYLLVRLGTRELIIRVMKARFFSLPETDNLTDNLMLTRTILRDFLPQYFAGQLTELECEIRFLTLLTEQARGLDPQALLGDPDVTQVLEDTTGMSEEEEQEYLRFYASAQSLVGRWNTQEWSYFLSAWSPL